ncbi:MAG TPA: hypothetical protein VGG03_15975 [Thermoanaerobaculia bacterium]
MTLGRAYAMFPVLAFALLTLGGACAMAATPPSPEALSRVLSDPELWGKDFPAVLAQLASWRRTGETTVAVFPDKVVGERRYAKREEAAAASERLRQEAAPPRPRSGLPGGMTQKIAGAQQELSRFRTEAQAFNEDDSYRVVWSAPSAQLLKPGLTVAKVRERLGQPTETRQLVLQTEGESRPVILTLYVYLGGAVAFAESDVATRPGSVDRVLLDLPAVTGVLFEKPQ